MPYYIGNGGRPLPSIPQSELEKLWGQAGGDPVIEPLMGAIAMAESGGTPNVYNGTCCYGLWQINAVHGYPVADMINPNKNAAEAVALYNAQGLSAWQTYTTGAYKAYLPKGAATSAHSTGKSSTSNTQSLAGLIFGSLIHPQKILGMLIGGFLIYEGTKAVMSTTPATNKIFRVITEPAKKAAKTAGKAAVEAGKAAAAA